jgi:hypothetical protein
VQNEGIPDSEYGIFVSIATAHDSEIVEVPAFVLALHRRVGGKVEFSFTFIS